MSRHSRRIELVRAIRQSERLHAFLRLETERAATATVNDLAQLRAAVSARVGSIRAGIDSSRRREIQRSLFDGRADADAASHNAALAALDLALQQRQRAIAAAIHSRDAVIDLIAIWPPARR